MSLVTSVSNTTCASTSKPAIFYVLALFLSSSNYWTQLLAPSYITSGTEYPLIHGVWDKIETAAVIHLHNHTKGQPISVSLLYLVPLPHVNTVSLNCTHSLKGWVVEVWNKQTVKGCEVSFGSCFFVIFQLCPENDHSCMHCGLFCCHEKGTGMCPLPKTGLWIGLFL